MHKIMNFFIIFLSIDGWGHSACSFSQGYLPLPNLGAFEIVFFFNYKYLITAHCSTQLTQKASLSYQVDVVKELDSFDVLV